MRSRHTTIISAYWPCISSTTGETTVYEQHARYFGAESKCPRELMIIDLAEFIKARQAQGDIIVLDMDVNEDVRSRQLKKYFEDLNLQEVILKKHSNRSPPAPCIKNDSRTPIDGIWCTLGIQPVAAGYLPFGAAIPSDHRALWADFRKADLLGKAMAEFRPHVAVLRADDPRDCEAYNLRSFVALEQNNTTSRLTRLNAITHDPSANDIQEYNELLDANTEIRTKIKASLRHVFGGEKPWSPIWKAAQRREQLWGRIVAYKSRHITNKQVKLTQIRRMMKITNIRDALECSLIDANYQWTAAKLELKQLTKDGWALRNSHTDALDLARAEAKDIPVPVESKRRKTIERQRRQGRSLRQLKNKAQSSVTQVFITTSDGSRMECNSKQEIEDACIEENHRRFSQTNDTPPMEEWIVEAVGYCAESPGGQEILDGTFVIPPTCNPYLAKLINGMRMPEIVRRLEPISTHISTKTHISGWRRQKERTASTQSDLNFSDHIAATFHFGMTEIDRLFRQIPYKMEVLSTTLPTHHGL
jgi:hypothetical protein